MRAFHQSIRKRSTYDFRVTSTEVELFLLRRLKIVFIMNILKAYLSSGLIFSNNIKITMITMALVQDIFIFFTFHLVNMVASTL